MFKIKRSLFTILATVSLLSFTACDDDDKTPLLLTVESISDSNNVVFEYYTPDPSCVDKMYWVTANSNASEVTLQSTNASSMYFHDNKTEYICTEGNWKVELIDSNTLKFTFDEIEVASDEKPSDVGTGLYLEANAGKETLGTNIHVKRLINYTDPVNPR